jgi:hypothetical protein
LAPAACRRARAEPGNLFGDEVTVAMERGAPLEPLSLGGSSTGAIFIYGAWLTPASWELLRSRYTACGYR